MLAVHPPSIAFDCASGSVLCKADGGGRYDDLKDLLTRIDRRMHVGEMTSISDDPKANISIMQLQVGKKLSPIRVMVRRACISDRLILDLQQVNSRLAAGDFVPVFLNNVNGKGLSTLLCTLDSTAQEITRMQTRDVSINLQNGYNKYWRGSIDILHPDLPHQTRFVVIDEIPAEELARSAELGTLVDIQFKLQGVIYYKQFSALAWSIEMIREYDDEGSNDEEEEEEEENVEEIVADQPQPEMSIEERMDELRAERRELVAQLQSEDDYMTDQQVEEINARLSVIKKELRELKSAL